jgi:hypothetical protein
VRLAERQATVLRAELPLVGLRPYVTSATAGEPRAATRQTLAGVDVVVGTSSAPLLRLPDAFAQAGLARGVDGPFVGRYVGYVGSRLGP